MGESPRSRLPKDPEYWEALAGRVRRDAAAPLAAYASADGSWYALVARRAPWLLAGSAAAMLLLWMSMPSTGPSPAAVWIEGSVAPTETAGTLIAGPGPPRVDVLMAQFAPVAGEGMDRR